MSLPDPRKPTSATAILTNLFSQLEDLTPTDRATLFVQTMESRSSFRVWVSQGYYEISYEIAAGICAKGTLDDPARLGNRVAGEHPALRAWPILRGLARLYLGEERLTERHAAFLKELCPHFGPGPVAFHLSEDEQTALGLDCMVLLEAILSSDTIFFTDSQSALPEVRGMPGDIVTGPAGDEETIR